jgi:ABC-type sugar transport system ATPase subunit
LVAVASITLRSVRKSYRDTEAVRGVELTVRDGEFLVVLGPSGCGKSTILRMVAGLERVTEGDVLIGDRVVTGVEPGDRDVAMVFQSYALYPHLSVRKNLAYGLRRRKVPKETIAAQVAETAALLGIEALMDRLPAQLSGGQRQRVALGRAIVRHPAVFLLDEPLSNLDAKLRVQMRNELMALHRRLGVTTMYVTHDQVEAMTMGERIVVMYDGRIQQIGTPLELYQRPANRFVATFLGQPQMNEVPGRLVATGAARRFVTDGLDIPLPGGPPGDRDLDVVLGVRPHALHAFRDPTPGRMPVAEGVVEVVEHLGAESFASVRVGPHLLTAVIEAGRPCEVGSRRTLCTAAESLHFFDAAGAALDLGLGVPPDPGAVPEVAVPAAPASKA